MDIESRLHDACVLLCFFSSAEGVKCDITCRRPTRYRWRETLSHEISRYDRSSKYFLPKLNLFSDFIQYPTHCLHGKSTDLKRAEKPLIPLYILSILVTDGEMWNWVSLWKNFCGSADHSSCCSTRDIHSTSSVQPHARVAGAFVPGEESRWQHMITSSSMMMLSYGPPSEKKKTSRCGYPFGRPCLRFFCYCTYISTQ